MGIQLTFQSSSFDQSATVSDEFPYENLHQRPLQGRHSHHVPSMEGNSTFPNRRAGNHPERFRIPSNQSMVSSHRSATSSVERGKIYILIMLTNIMCANML